MDDVIYSVRYEEFESWQIPLTDVAAQDSLTNMKLGPCISKKQPSGPGKTLGRIEYLACIDGAKKAEELVHKVKHYSEKHRVSADIRKLNASITCWLFFGAELLNGKKKDELIKLLEMADEVSIIPYPESMKGVCDFVLILNCTTHRRFIDGIELTKT